LFFAGGWLLKKFGDYKLMIFGTVMYVLRFILYSFVQTPELMIAVSLMQGITFPLIMITSKTLVDNATPVELRASGQTIASSIYGGVSLLIAPSLAGVIASVVGLDLTLAIFGLSGLLVLVLGSMYKKI
jgi:MFS family permease